MPDKISNLLENFIAETSVYHENREVSRQRENANVPSFLRRNEDIDFNSRRVNLDAVHDASRPAYSQSVLWRRFLQITAQASFRAVEKAQRAREDMLSTGCKSNSLPESDVWILSLRTKPRVVHSLEFSGVVDDVDIDFQPLFDLDSSMSFFDSSVCGHQSPKRRLYEDFSSCKVQQPENLSTLSVSNLHEIHLSERKLAYDSTTSEDHFSDFKSSRESLVSRLKSETRAIFGQILHVTAVLLQDVGLWTQQMPSRSAIAHLVLSDAFSIECTSKSSNNHANSPLPTIFSKKYLSEEKESPPRQTFLQHPDIMCCSRLLALGITNQLQNTSMMELLHLTTLIEKRWQETPNEALHNSTPQRITRTTQASFKSRMKWDPVIISVLFAYALPSTVDKKRHTEANQVLVRCICNGEYPTTSEAYARVVDKYPIASSNIGDCLTMYATIFVLGLRNIGHADNVISGLFHHVIFHTDKSSSVVSLDAVSPEQNLLENTNSFTYLKYFQEFENAFPGRVSGGQRVASFKQIFTDFFLKFVTSLAYGCILFRCDPHAFHWETHRETILSLSDKHTAPYLVEFIESFGVHKEATNQVDVMLLSMVQARKLAHGGAPCPFQLGWSQLFSIVIYGLSFAMSNSIVFATILVFPFCCDAVQAGTESPKCAEITNGIDYMPPSEVFLRFLFAHFTMWDALVVEETDASDHKVSGSELAWREILHSAEAQFSASQKNTYGFAAALAQQSARHFAIAVKMSATCDAMLKKTLLKSLHSLLFTADPSAISLHKEATQQALCLNVISLSLVTMGSSDADVLGIVRALEEYDRPMMQIELLDLSSEERHYVDLFRASPNFGSICDHNFAYIKDHYCTYAKIVQKTTVQRANHLHTLLSVIVHLFVDITFADLSLLAPFMRLLLGCAHNETTPRKHAE
ncbi:Lantibiotic modifying enzyme [Perkinsela sp. CCAP 1560/4]|nr:Lantibiotic modifying enzyme [Perkinsela sp. CCAP 1560/4]|eukprot:KNH05174.1 Lantibiotic modifying enzyme [Perkinsela sp. CCAP 1560/4]